MSRPRIGTVSYVNARPLTDALDRERYEVIEAIPSAIARQLVEGAIDVGLVPVRAVLDDPSLRILPGWCVGAEGPVHSVVIVAETEPESWTELVLDGSSRTSVTLARLLVAEGPLSDRVRDDLVITDGAPGEGPKRVGGTVAAVVIGDPARALPASLQRWDLAELWTAWTGRPFVFAVWAARGDLDPVVREDLRDAGRRGVEGIASRYAGEDLDYLTKHLRYALDEPALIGLREFAARAHRAGLVGDHVVQLFDPPIRRRARRDLDTALSDAASGLPVDTATLQALAEDVSGADLQLAARIRRDTLHGPGRATWLWAHGIAEDASLDTTLAEAAEAGVTSLTLSGPEVTPERVARVRAAGLLPRVEVLPAGSSLDAWFAAGLEVMPLAAEALDVERAAAWRALGGVLEIHLDLSGADAVGRIGALADQVGVLRPLAVVVHLPLPEGALVAPGRPTPAAWLRGVSATRLALQEVPHVVASPSTQGLAMAQAALLAGADDLGVVGPCADARPWPEGIARFESDAAEAERMIRAVGCTPVRRSPAFVEVGEAITSARRVRPVGERDRAAVRVREV